MSARHYAITARRREGRCRTWDNSNVRGRLIRGVATTPSLDSHQTRIWPHGLSVELPVPLMLEHKGPPIGEVCFIEAFDDLVLATAMINYQSPGNIVWQRVCADEKLALSIRFEPSFVFGINITKWRLEEISVVERPSNRDTWLERYRPPVRINF